MLRAPQSNRNQRYPTVISRAFPERPLDGGMG